MFILGLAFAFFNFFLELYKLMFFLKKEKDKYNNEITKIARPLPVEYLIVDLPAAFAKDATYTFNDSNTAIKTRFPIENRSDIGEKQVLIFGYFLNF